MATAYENLVGRSLEWTGVHHSLRIVAGGAPFAVADGSFREVEALHKPAG